MFGFVRGVTCEKCKHVVTRASAQHVLETWEWPRGTGEDLWYCVEHRRPYDGVEHRWDGRNWVKHYVVYSVRVQEDGTLIDVRFQKRQPVPPTASDLEARPVVTLE